MVWAEALKFEDLGSFQNIQEKLLENDGKIFVFLGEGLHKIKRKAEQIACQVTMNHSSLRTI